MKTSCEVFDAIEHIASTSGKNQQTLIGEYMDSSDLFVEICKRALDPFVTYGIKKVEEVETLNGDKPKSGFDQGTWHLLDRLANRKLTGSAAHQAIAQELVSLPPKSAVLLTRIIKKDLRAKFSAKSLNKHRPGTVFIFDCMLSHKYEPKRIKAWPVAVEPKFDGVRCLAIVKDGACRFYSRTGREYLNYGHIGDQILKLLKAMQLAGRELVLDGEMMAGDFKATVETMRKTDADTSDVNFHVFEVMSLADFENGNPNEFLKRRKLLNHILSSTYTALHPSVMPTECRIMHSEEEIMNWNAELQAAGGEGVIVKPLDGLYVRKRSHDWLKIKACESADVQITGAFPGEGKYKGMLGGFTVDFNGVEVNVGSGLSDADRTLFWPLPTEILGALIEVQYHEVTPDGSLRHPRFVRFRDDKPIEDGTGVAA